MTFGIDNCNNFGIGMPPGMGMGMGLTPGSSVKITKTTTGGPSVFTGRRFYQGGGGFVNTTSIDIQHGPSGFWGFALGALDGFRGRCMTGWNNMCSRFNFGGWGMNGGYGFNSMQMPIYAPGLNFGAGTTNSTQTTLLGNLEKMGNSKGWTIVQNPDGTFWANLPADKSADGKPKVAKGNYDSVMKEIVESEGKEKESPSQA